MNIAKLKQVVDEIQMLNMVGASDSTLIRVLVEFLYGESDGKLAQYFMMIDEIQKEKIEEEKMILYKGLEDAMHSLSGMSEHIDDGEFEQLKDLNELIFYPEDGNIAFVINIAKAYFPEGSCQGASYSGKNFFNKFLRILRENKEKFLNGDNTEWAKHFGHYDYIKLVLEKNTENESVGN